MIQNERERNRNGRILKYSFPARPAINYRSVKIHVRKCSRGSPHPTSIRVQPLHVHILVLHCHHGGVFGPHNILVLCLDFR